jgi:hypothetical protein
MDVGQLKGTFRLIGFVARKVEKAYEASKAHYAVVQTLGGEAFVSVSQEIFSRLTQGEVVEFTGDLALGQSVRLRALQVKSLGKGS